MVGVVATAAVAGLVITMWSDLGEDERRALRWLAVGAVACIVISVGGFPGSRLLLFPSIGGSVVVGAILVHGWTAFQSKVVTAMRRVGWVSLFGVHVLLAPFMFMGSTAMLAAIGARTSEIDASLDDVLPAPVGAVRAPMVFLVASDPVAGMYAGAAHAMRVPGTFSGWSILSMARATHDILRTDDRTLVIRTDRAMLQGAYDGVFRDPARAPIVAGDRVELDDATITVLADQRGYPTAIEVRFATALEDDRMRLLAWQNGKLLPLRVPVGDHVVVPWTPGPTGFF